MSEEIKQNIKLPEPSLRRLPWYLAYVKLLKEQGEVSVSSTQISKEIGVDSSQIAKDLSFINITGKTRVGYEVNSLVDALESFLGFNQQHRAAIFGVGSLGAALIQDSGLSQYGMQVVAGFDINPQLVGSSINGVPIYHISQFHSLQKGLDVTIGVLTVPVDRAQEVTEQMVQGEIKAVWNFTPFRIRVPQEIVVQNTSIYAHLAVMFNRINTQER